MFGNKSAAAKAVALELGLAPRVPRASSGSNAPDSSLSPHMQLHRAPALSHLRDESQTSQSLRRPLPVFGLSTATAAAVAVPRLPHSSPPCIPASDKRHAVHALSPRLHIQDSAEPCREETCCTLPHTPQQHERPSCGETDVY